MPRRPILHVVFGMSAAGNLRQAFKLIGCDERVIGLPDDLSFGPISPPDLISRVRWVDRLLGFGREWAGEWGLGTADFWADATTPNFKAVAWVCRYSAAEYAGFMEWLWRQGDRECVVIDVTGLVVQFQPRGEAPHAWQIGAFGEVPTHQIIAHRLWDRKRSLASAEQQAYRIQWDALRTENAPLRVLEADQLVSAPLTFFDPLILSCVSVHPGTS